MNHYPSWRNGTKELIRLPLRISDLPVSVMSIADRSGPFYRVILMQLPRKTGNATKTEELSLALNVFMIICSRNNGFCNLEDAGL